MHIPIIILLLAILAYFLFFRKKKTSSIETMGSVYEKEITEKSFEDMVMTTSNRTPVLVDFYADWCPPCHHLTPLLSEIANEYQGAFLLAKIDAEKNQALSEKYAVEAYPTVVLFKAGEPIERFTGAKLEHSIRFTLAKHGIKPNENNA